MRADGCSHAMLEVSSHALSQRRVAGCCFAAAIFTNLTRDHLDYHGDEASYFEAKASLFEEYVAHDGVCAINIDDSHGRTLTERLVGRRCVTFSTVVDSDADVRVVAESMTLAGMRLRAYCGGREIELKTRLLGHPNVSNIAAVVATAFALGVSEAAVVDGVSSAAPVPGRLERVGRSLPAVLVDYAHTPDALERVLATVREITPRRLIVVFGCGGDRDRGKRPMMGEAAGRLADLAVITSDNPRSERPAAIIDDIEKGMLAVRASRLSPAELAVSVVSGYGVEPDRAAAIALALRAAREGDVVLVAGKGHEDYQEIEGTRHPFDDRTVVRQLQERT
jgi:UDP-N-acetylmuramoyl-L-alanyl-D-glutamate--2,6-diaminopimelate ligase